MGWSGTDNLMWGDDPQDKVDDAIGTYYAGVAFDAYRAYPEAAKRKALATLKQDEELRQKVDAAYQREWGRDANDKEFENLLLVGLGLPGGKTLFMPKAKKTRKGQRKTAGRKPAHGIVRGLRR